MREKVMQEPRLHYNRSSPLHDMEGAEADVAKLPGFLQRVLDAFEHGINCLCRISLRQPGFRRDDSNQIVLIHFDTPFANGDGKR